MVKITFLGTRGEIKRRSKRHQMHTALLIAHRGVKIMIDCGYSWVDRLKKIKPDFIFLTHAHPDHAWGLKKGAPCPVIATKASWDVIGKYPIEERRVIPLRKKRRIAGITFEAFPVLHSILCPAVGYRIVCGPVRFFYVPDVAYIYDIELAFRRIQFYIGDGATVTSQMIRKHKESGEIIGHATVRQQLTWCRKQRVPKMIVTHCGSSIVSREKSAIKRIERFAEERGVEVEIAYDGMRREC